MNVAKTNKTNSVEIAQFSKAPRSNFLIELLRIVALIVLILNHYTHMGIVKVPALEHLGHWTSSQFGVFSFIAITGIFTIGKGKDYFLRNFSRLLFVIVALSALLLPLFFQLDMNAVKNKLDGQTVLYGGRDGGYLGAIVVCSLFFPFIKIEKFILNNKLFSLIAVIIVFIATNTFRLLYGGDPFTFLGVFVFGVCTYVMGILYQSWGFHKKALSIQIFAIVTFCISSLITGFLKAGAIAPVSMSLLVMACATTKFKTPKGLNVVVRNSYYVYETHFVFQSLYALWLKDHYHQFGYTLNGEYFNNVYFENAKQYGECFGFVFGASFVTSIVFSQLQTHVWERFVAKNTLYLYQPFSKGGGIILGLFIALFGSHYFLGVYIH